MRRKLGITNHLGHHLLAPHCQHLGDLSHGVKHRWSGYFSFRLFIFRFGPGWSYLGGCGWFFLAFKACFKEMVFMFGFYLTQNWSKNPSLARAARITGIRNNPPPSKRSWAGSARLDRKSIKSIKSIKLNDLIQFNGNSSDSVLK